MKLKTIQDAINEFTKEDIIYQYNQLFPVEYENYDENMSVKDIKALRNKELYEYIEKMTTLKTKPYEKGNRIFFSHKSNDKSAIFNVDFSMAAIDEVQQCGESAPTYAFSSDLHENLMGAYISPATHTQNNLLPLIAYVLYIGQLHGYNQERLEEMSAREEAAHKAFMEKLKGLTNIYDVNELRRDISLPVLLENPLEDTDLFAEYSSKKAECNEYWISVELDELQQLLKGAEC